MVSAVPVRRSSLTRPRTLPVMPSFTSPTVFGLSSTLTTVVADVATAMPLIDSAVALTVIVPDADSGEPVPEIPPPGARTRSHGGVVEPPPPPPPHPARPTATARTSAAPARVIVFFISFPLLQ